MNFDVAVIGGGPGGYVAALRSAQLGLKTAAIEAAEIGGTCLNCGCIPTKALLHVAKIKGIVEAASPFGLNASLDSFDINGMVKRSDDLISDLRAGVENLLTANNISLFRGFARFKDKNSLLISDINGSSFAVSARNIVIATGAKARMLPNVDKSLLEKGLIWTSKEAITPRFIPKKLLIIGSGAIGMELATFYKSFGADVTISEIQDRVLSMEDKEISDFAKHSFMKRGICIKLKTKSENIREEDGKIAVDFVNDLGEIDDHCLFDVAIVAIGVVPNTSNLDLGNAGISISQDGSINVSDYQETTQSGVYAIGDVAQPPYLAHKASREGVICAEHIAGLKDVIPLNSRIIPSCTYSDPQIASIGLTEDMCRKSGFNIKIGKSYFRGNGKAATAGERDGFVKVLLDGSTEEIVGAHLVGGEVTELVSIFAVAMAGELTAREFMYTVFPHPTISECLYDAVSSAVYSKS